MFAGILGGTGQVVELEDRDFSTRIRIENGYLLADVEIGASISVDGVCLTVVNSYEMSVAMDVVPQTTTQTTLSELRVGSLVNLERALRLGNEIGGHLLSGHAAGTIRVLDIDRAGNRHRLTLDAPEEIARYLFDKAYVGLHGASLTVSSKDPGANTFSVDLIPETLRVTNLGLLEPGSPVNIEIDHQTRVVVDTMMGLLRSQKLSDAARASHAKPPKSSCSPAMVRDQSNRDLRSAELDVKIRA